MNLKAQLALEEEMCSGGRVKMQTMLETNEEAGRAASNPYAQALYRRFVLPVSESISKDLTIDLAKPGRNKAHAVLLRGIDPDTIAFIGVRCVINVVFAEGGNETCTNVAQAIGGTIYGELLLKNFEDIDPGLYHTMIRDLASRMSKSERHRLTVFRMEAKKRGMELPEWGQADKIQVGMYVLDHLVQAGLCGIDKTYVHGKSVNTVGFSEWSMETIEEMSNWILGVSPKVMPCVYPPRPWISVDDGGFHGAMRKSVPRAVTVPHRNIEIMQERGFDPSVVLKMLNYHQARPWQINRFVLETVQQAMAKPGLETKEIISTAGLPKPERPEFLDRVKSTDEMSFDEKGIFTSWKRETADWHSAMKLRGQRWGRLNAALRVADRFKDHEELYFVYRIDFRGRMYPVTNGISPQGSDLQRAMLRSAKGYPVPEGAPFFWFCVHGANVFGVDKLTLEARVQWVRANHDSIVRCAQNPVGRDEFNWWSDADKPMQFIAWCDEYYRRSLNPSKFLSHLTAGMDGSCNGLQNFSAMLRDPVGAKSTNLLPSTKAGPEDIYSDVAQVTVQLVQQALATDETGLLARWLKAGINRTLVKRSVMTLPYGSTRFSCADFILFDYLREGKTDEFEPKEFAAAAGILSHKVWAAIGLVVIKAREAMQYLQSTVKAALKQDGYISWLTPTGFRVVQVYQRIETMRVRTRLLGSCMIRMGVESDTPDGYRHKNGIAPNFIHSIDASHMAFVTCAAEDEGIPFLSMVHDDFGAPFLYAEDLYRIIREQFIRLHESDPLKAYADSYGLKSPPARGDLDIHSVLESPYFFS